ncbi:hypothetical protein OCF84_21365 (plasmid) [Shewanella xiamenensis]|uniref:Uncharacterized protein n=1 Tax=Shewanella xiamenensis TaxID=332186 RepID=A0ABT6UDM7_9GAMM|nr:hypothetical protein [Shewanella xiamenensis]MDI5832573.1 hypothetical protein [Shewanella xiamenensis]WHF57808.1 hypothetical protein OCF84_21365 [Shewanella xiamenensis]
MHQEQLSHYPMYAEAREQGLIELNILPVCDALAELGANPLASCSGHVRLAPDLHASLLSNLLSFGKTNRKVCISVPYVLFSSSNEIAGKVNCAVEAFPIKLPNGQLAKKYLFFVWNVVGSFDDKGRLRFSLTTNDHRLTSNSEWLLENIGIIDAMLKEDLAKIAVLLADVPC